MLNRLASSFLAVILAAGTAGAHDFARPPQARRLPLPMVDRAAVKKALVERREHNLAAFRTYRKAGVYPHNFVRPGPLNVWRDEEGHLCAAATMIDRDGQHALVAKIAETQNALRLLDVTEGPVMDWMLTSGLTIEEIDRIQLPMQRPDEGGIEQWRAQEDARLSKAYAETDAWLVKHADEGLESAVTRLMQHPLLAKKLVDGRL
jgi:hypothetical protein